MRPECKLDKHKVVITEAATATFSDRHGCNRRRRLCERTRDVEEDRVVAEGGAGVQTGVRQLHRLDLQPTVADVHVLAVRHRHVVLGPADIVGGVPVGAAQVQLISEVQREQLRRRFHGDCQRFNRAAC